MNRLSALFLWIVLFVITTAPIGALADAEENEKPPPDALQEANIHFEQGVEFYHQMRFEEAAIEFARAYELKPNFKLLFNIAQAENMLEHYARALSAYKKYLADGGDEVPEDRKQLVEKEMARLEFRVGRLEVRCPEEGATVLVDGEDQGRTPVEEPILLDVGKHEVEVVKDNHRLYRRVHRVAGGQQLVVDLTSPQKAETEPSQGTEASETSRAPEPPPEEASGGNPRKAIAWSTIGVGAAAGVGAVVTGAIALSGKKKVQNGCDDYSCPRDDWESQFEKVGRLSLTTDILIGVAAAGVITGVLLLVVKPKSDGERAAAVGAAPAAGGGALMISGRF